MLSAHQTVKQAWSKFKTYPNLKQIIIYITLLSLPAITAESFMELEGDSLSVLQIANLIFLIPLFLAYYLNIAAIANYVYNGWTFANWREYLKPPTSLFRLFWKSFVVMLTILLPVAIFGAASYTAAQGGIGNYSIGVILAMCGFTILVILIVKLFITTVFFAVNPHARLNEGLNVSKEHFWFIVKVGFWVFLYGILLILLAMVMMVVVGLVGMLLGPIGLFLITLLSFLLQNLATLLITFIQAETYNQIAENKP